LCDEAFWRDHNRSLSLQAVALGQDYTEYDTQGLTTDGILDTEKGAIPGWGVQARWQGNVAGLPLWLQAGYQESRGQTDYQGYLQSGATLTPFSARTGNTLTEAGLALGVPLKWSGQDAQFIPYLEIGDQRWQRNLVGYGETYQSRSASLGLLTQWRFTPVWTFEASAEIGRLSHAHLNVPPLSFSADLDSAHRWRAGLGLNYQLAARVGIGAHWSQTRWRTQASDIVNGFQAPPARTRQDSLGVSLNWHY
jgi:hypothetical protein